MRAINTLAALLALAGIVWGLKLGLEAPPRAARPPSGSIAALAEGPWIPADKEEILRQACERCGPMDHDESSALAIFFTRGGTLRDLQSAARALAGRGADLDLLVSLGHLLGILRRCGAEQMSWRLRPELTEGPLRIDCEYQGKPDLPWRLHDEIFGHPDLLTPNPQECQWITLDPPRPGGDPIILGRMHLLVSPLVQGGVR